MANRVIEQKILKMKRRGKHRVRGKQFINTGQGPKIGAVSELYRHKLVDSEFDKYLNFIFPGKVYSDKELIERNMLSGKIQVYPEDVKALRTKLEKDNTIPLAEVKSLLLSMQQRTKQTAMENHFRLVNKLHHRIDLFFSADKTCWCIIEIDILNRYARRSVTFSSQSLARQALRLQAVEWVETIPLRLPT